MLSRRRSSERASLAAPPGLAHTPAQRRLNPALRGATILFSVPAQLDPTVVVPAPAAATPSQPLPNLSADPAVSDLSAMRRLFSREARLRRPRAPVSPDHRPIHHLAVAAHGKAADNIRLHQLVDYGPGARAAVHRTWPLADLRKIDGLGRPVNESLQFALFFASSTRVTTWRCNTPLDRATFLWALLQTCVSHLKRAPPVSNLLLLDLQTIAESSTSPEKPEPDDSSSGPSQGHTKINSSIDELAAERDQQSDGLMRAAADPSDSSINPALSPNPSTAASTQPNNSASAPHLSQGQGIFQEDDDILLDEDDERARDHSPQSLIRARGRMMREMAKNQRVKRTLSEPKVSKLRVDSVDDSDSDPDDFILKKADTIAPGQKAADPKLKDLNIDERAFLAAAKRMGANRSFEMKRVADPDRESSQESDPRARLFQHRLKMGEANTAKVVAERKVQQEKKLFRLSSEEQQDLSFALKWFQIEKDDRQLDDFGSWAEARIQGLEVENIADIVNVEKNSMPHRLGDHLAEDAQGQKSSLQGWEEDKWPYSTLVSSMTFAEPWLEKCQTLLAPYAELAEDINNGVILLEVQRHNVSNLNTLLTELIQTLSFEQSEQSLLDGIGAADASLSLSEFDGEDFQAAAQVIASKVAALKRFSALSDMTAVTKVQNLLLQRQREASTILVPMLTGYIDQLYEREEACVADLCFQKLRRSRLREMLSSEREEFLTGLKSLSVFGRSEFLDLVEHFAALSADRVKYLFRAVMGKDRSDYRDIDTLVARTETLSECLFYACVLEGSQACQLFGIATETPSDNDDFCLANLLRKQICNDEIINEFITDGSGDNKALQTCLHVHACYYLDHFSTRVANISEEEMDSLIITTESGLEDGNDDSIFAKLEQGESKSSTALSSRNEDELSVGMRTWSGSNVSVREASTSPSGTRVDQSTGCFGSRECMTYGVSNFYDICSYLSHKCNSFVDEHVNTVIGNLSTPVDINSDFGRAQFLSFVEECVDLCDHLTSPTFALFNGAIGAHHVVEGTKSQCERLVAAAMRSIEVTTHNCVEGVSDAVKLQCYGYIAAKLGAPEKPDFLLPLAHLSSRVWKHVMAKWAERELFDSLFGGLRIVAAKRPADAHAQFESAVSELDVAQAVGLAREGLLSALGPAASGVVLKPCCNKFISLTKEKLEDTLRVAKKQKQCTETRFRLLKFSRELLSSLRTELGGM